MNLRPTSLLALFLACAPAVHAVRPAPAEVDAKTGAPVKTEATAKVEPPPPYELKNRSSFATSAEAPRAPFWPIGWVKRNKAGAVVEVVEAPVAPKALLDEKSFKLTSILLASGATPSLAVINGRAYSEGEFLRQPRTPGVSPLRIRVQRIADGTVTLQNGAQTLYVALQRTELSSRRPEELLIDADR